MGGYSVEESQGPQIGDLGSPFQNVVQSYEKLDSGDRVSGTLCSGALPPFALVLGYGVSLGRVLTNVRTGKFCLRKI